MPARHWPAHRTSAVAAVLTLAMMACDSNASAQHARNVEFHANTATTAASVGLPEFPGARANSDSDSNSSVDMGLTFGDFHFRVLVSKYETDASQSTVLDYYRKPLAKYGDVLECDHGEPVGALTRTRGGLTCSDEDHDHHSSHTGSSSSHDLRAGSEHLFRIVAIDNDSKHANSSLTHFDLVLVETPKDNDEHDDRH